MNVIKRDASENESHVDSNEANICKNIQDNSQMEEVIIMIMLLIIKILTNMIVKTIQRMVKALVILIDQDFMKK